MQMCDGLECVLSLPEAGGPRWVEMCGLAGAPPAPILPLCLPSKCDCLHLPAAAPCYRYASRFNTKSYGDLVRLHFGRGGAALLQTAIVTHVGERRRSARTDLVCADAASRCWCCAGCWLVAGRCLLPAAAAKEPAWRRRACTAANPTAFFLCRRCHDWLLRYRVRCASRLCPRLSRRAANAAGTVRHCCALCDCAGAVLLAVVQALGAHVRSAILLPSGCPF